MNYNRYKWVVLICITGIVLPGCLPREIMDDPVLGPLVHIFGYELGNRLGQRTTEKIWEDVSEARGCDAADDLVSLITNATSTVAVQIRQQPNRNEAISFVEGYIYGLRNALRNIALECTDKCAVIGEAAGQASAIFFCELANVIGTIPTLSNRQDMPNITCGEPYRTNCELSFGSMAMQNCSGIINAFPRNMFDQYFLANYGGVCAYRASHY